MFSFKKNDVERLLEESGKDAKALEMAEVRKKKLLPEWHGRHAECVRLAVEVEIGDKTFSMTSARRSDCFTKEAIATAKAKLEQAITDRDGVFEAVLVEIETINRRIFRRGSIVTGAFGSWASRIVEKLADGDPQRQKLLQVRRSVELLQQDPRGLQRMIGMISVAVEEFESNEQVDIPLFRFAETVRKALAVQ